LEAEAGTSSRVAELEEMVSALQQEKKDLEASLASMHIRAETSIRQLDEARAKALAAEDAAKTAEEGWKKAEELARTFRQAVVNEAMPLQSEVHCLLEHFEIESPPLAGEDANSVELVELFRWLRCCAAMTDCGSQFFGELNASVAARSLIAAVCSLLEAPAGGEASVTKSKLCTLRDPGVQWPSTEEVKPEMLPALPRNIAMNFMATFFQESGREVVVHKGERMKAQVGPLFVCCCLRLLSLGVDMCFI